MRLALEHRDRRHVERIARGRFERADAALAQNHIAVALRHDVLGRHQQLGDRGGQATLEQHRPLRTTHFGEEWKVLHVARADLQDIGVPRHQLHLSRIHYFRHDRHARVGTHLGQDLEPFLTHALKRIRRRAWFEGAGAQQSCPRALHRMGRGVHHVAPFHRAGTGNHDQITSANHGIGRVAQADHRGLHRKLARRQLVRLKHRQHTLHAFKLRETVIAQQSFIADTAHDCAVFAARHMRA